MTDLSVPVFQTGSVYVQSTSLTSVLLPALQTVNGGGVIGGIAIDANTSLTTLSAPMLTGNGPFRVTNNPQLPSCQARAIATHGTWSSVTISGNDDTATCP